MPPIRSMIALFCAALLAQACVTTHIAEFGSPEGLAEAVALSERESAALEVERVDGTVLSMRGAALEAGRLCGQVIGETGRTCFAPEQIETVSVPYGDGSGGGTAILVIGGLLLLVWLISEGVDATEDEVSDLFRR